MIRTALATFAAAACYGVALGAAHSELYAARNALKFPLLIVVTSTVCSLGYWMAARMLLAPLSFADAQRASWTLFRDVSILLASLAPVVLFLAIVMRTQDDGRLGEYDFFLGANIAAIAFAGLLALIRQVKFLGQTYALSSARAAALVVAWAALSAGVGGQAAFYMRPFFGFPATRGANPPFFLGATPDLRGATNFYEAVLQTTSRPPLPKWLDEGAEPR